MATLKLNSTNIKILETIYLLNKNSFYPLPEGIKKILNGTIDDDTKNFINLITFGNIISIKGRKLNSCIHQLVRYGYLGYKHNKKNNQLYLCITFKGKTNLEDYKKKHKIKYQKKNKKEKAPTIVLIE